jgi:hypothetical protein
MERLNQAALLAGVLMLAACAVQTRNELPFADATATFTSAIGGRNLLGSRTVTPLAVIEDSRCPANVQCIQAGTVRLKVRVEEGRLAREATVGLNQPAALDAAWLHLVGVCPPRGAPGTAPRTAYQFTFAITQAAERPSVAVSCTQIWKISAFHPSGPNLTSRLPSA